MRWLPPSLLLSLLCRAVQVGQAALNSHESVYMESHECNGAQKLEITRVVLVLLASTQNMNRTSPGPWVAPYLSLHPRGRFAARE
jgi:hypothetical protein